MQKTKLLKGFWLFCMVLLTACAPGVSSQQRANIQSLERQLESSFRIANQNLEYAFDNAYDIVNQKAPAVSRRSYSNTTELEAQKHQLERAYDTLHNQLIADIVPILNRGKQQINSVVSSRTVTSLRGLEDSLNNSKSLLSNQLQRNYDIWLSEFSNNLEQKEQQTLRDYESFAAIESANIQRRQAAAEAERQRQAAAAEAERQRQAAAAEAERQRQAAAAEAERQRQAAAAEAERQRQVAATIREERTITYAGRRTSVLVYDICHKATEDIVQDMKIDILIAVVSASVTMGYNTTFECRIPPNGFFVMPSFLRRTLDSTKGVYDYYSQATSEVAYPKIGIEAVGFASATIYTFLEDGLNWHFDRSLFRQSTLLNTNVWNREFPWAISVAAFPEGQDDYTLYVHNPTSQSRKVLVNFYVRTRSDTFVTELAKLNDRIKNVLARLSTISVGVAALQGDSSAVTNYVMQNFINSQLEEMGCDTKVAQGICSFYVTVFTDDVLGSFEKARRAFQNMQ